MDPIEIKNLPPQSSKTTSQTRRTSDRAKLSQLSLTPAITKSLLALAAQASAERPVRTLTIVVPLRRTMMTVLRVPHLLSGGLWKILGYLYWLTLIGCLMVGAIRGLRRRNFITLLPLALIIGRLVLPIASALGSEPRYLFEALPSCFILAAYAFDPDARPEESSRQM